MSGAIMIVCGFIPKMWALLMAIPVSVTASVLFVALSSQFMAGIHAIISAKEKIEPRDSFIMDPTVLFGTTISIPPKPFFQLLPGSVVSLARNDIWWASSFLFFLEQVIFCPKESKEILG